MIGLAAVKARKTSLLEVHNRGAGGLLFRYQQTIDRIGRRFGQEAALRWTQALASYKGHINVRQLESAIASGNLRVVESVVNAGALQQQLQRTLRDPLFRAAGAGGATAAAALTAHGVAASFNAVHSNVINYARTRAGALVTSIPQDVRETIRLVTALGASGRATIEQQARMIKEVIGIPRNWTSAPLRFGDELRAARFSGHLGTITRRLSGSDMVTIRTHLERGTLTDKVIQDLQAKYTERLISLRAETIARTESLAAANWGTHEAWKQAIAKGELPRNVKRFWIVSADDRLCPVCAEIPGLNPNGVGIGEPFDTPEGPVMDPPAPHPNCRCATGLIMPDEPEFDEEPEQEPADRGTSPRGGIVLPPVSSRVPVGPFADDAEILARPTSHYRQITSSEETIGRFHVGGKWTPERLELHDAIVRSHFKDVTPLAAHQRPTAVVLGGGPASGKSAVIRAGMKTANHVVVDVDHIRTMLPEYAEGIAMGNKNISAITHEEASALAKRIVGEAQRARYNMLLDGTGDSNLEWLSAKVTGYRQHGHRIVAHYVTVDTEIAMARMLDRARKTGRYVPETYLREVHKGVSAVLPQAIDAGLFDSLTLWDTNAANRAVRVATATGRKLRVLDEVAWQRFLAKANDDNPLLAPARNIILGAGQEPAAIARYLGAYGQQWEAAPLPVGIGRMGMKQCYQNATRLVLENPEYRYVEGIAYTGRTGDLPFLHAWAVTPEGRVVDPTWGNPGGARYFGVAYDRTAYLKYIRARRYYGVLGGDDDGALRALNTGAWRLRWTSRRS